MRTLGEVGFPGLLLIFILFVLFSFLVEHSRYNCYRVQVFIQRRQSTE